MEKVREERTLMTPPGLRRCKDSGISERVFRGGLTLGLLVSMLYHRMDAQAFGI